VSDPAVDQQAVETSADVIAGVDSGVTAATAAAQASGYNPEAMAFLFILAMFLGLELIAKVPATLHTPLMSGSNAISGITLIGAMSLAAGSFEAGPAAMVLGSLAVGFAAINVVGGYLVTDRMLGMFKSKKGGA
jgi:NAD(P) transhydrogenase subunit alpha